jgi:hypothetical protein
MAGGTMPLRQRAAAGIRSRHSADVVPMAATRKHRHRLARRAARAERRACQQSEQGLPSAADRWSGAAPRLPRRPHPVDGNGEIFLRGARVLGIEARVGPVASASGRFGNRPHRIYR